MANNSHVEDRHNLKAAFDASELSLDDLWLRYFSLGGTAGLTEVEAFLSGLMEFGDLEHDILAHAINERLDELAPLRARYRTDAAGP